ncbi:MAG TPA: penicillin acylase family protein [Sphingomicrobium sp.]|nr:penicillin acylase family protein [Sphingomicrobium sp.]
MRALVLPALLFLLTAASPPDIARWRTEASHVTITRDDWGIAHVHGHTDADAVFGMIYAQAEDDFPRIEANYLTNLGRTAEADGEKAIWQDLRARLYVSPSELKADYARSPLAMRKLMDAWADGLNYFFATHPNVHPRVITHFEPWMVMSFTEGSIGGDIERIDLNKLEAFYSSRHPGLEAGSALSSDKAKGRQVPGQARDDVLEPQGSNGIAIGPKLTSDGSALLLINPHTSFYFRSELQMASDEGLDVYGAATWGQFFIYQGFNPHAGWMHTSTGVDNVDEFAEKVERRGSGYCYWYGRTCRPIGVRPITIRYRTPDGHLASRSFNAWMTHRGPIVAADDGRWIAFAMMNRPVEALQQSFLRTKTTDLKSYMRISDLKANSSNNTVFADDKGEIAVLAPQFMPRRDNRFDYSRPVDGSNPAADWHGLHEPSQLPNTINPPNGWAFNSNDWLYSAAGPYSPKPTNFPAYLDSAGESYRTIHATRLLTQPGRWSLDRLQTAAFDSAQPSWEVLVPMLASAWKALPPTDPRRGRLAEPIAALSSWDKRWSVTSIPNTLANFWGDELAKAATSHEWNDHRNFFRHMEALSPAEKLDTFTRAIDRLERDFGGWRVPWGEVNRFQRIDPAIDARFDDRAPSIPVGFTSNKWGSLASFGASQKPGTKRWYGTNGNSFVAVVEFTPHGPHARAVTAGGESGHPDSPHFKDEAQRYASGALREVYFYPEQLKGHAEPAYHPGE